MRIREIHALTELNPNEEHGNIIRESFREAYEKDSELRESVEQWLAENSMDGK